MSAGVVGVMSDGKVAAEGWPEGVIALGSPLVRCHLLVAGGEAVLIDTGLWGMPARVRRAMAGLGLGPRNLKAVLLTHGHLDHAGGLHEIVAWSGASVYAHPAEQAHVDGVFPYEGIARWCGRLERAGRWVGGYQPTRIDEPLADGVVLPFFGGLTVVHLPGHTAGHCGFYCAREGVLFSGDLFASYGVSTHLPPAILNSCPGRFAESFARVAELDPAGLIPSHYDVRDAVLHRRRFERLLRGRG